MFICREISFEEKLEWDQLIEKSSTASFFQTKEWVQVWVKHFPVEMKILGVFEGEELIGLAAFSLVNETIHFLGTTPVLGGELVSDFGDIIAKTSYEETVWKEVFAKLKVKKLKADLNYIRGDSPSFPILKEMGGRVEEVDDAPYIDLPNTWDAYVSTLNRHDRHELKRKLKKAESEQVTLVLSQNVRSDTDEFFRLMQLSNIQKKDFLTEKMQAFFRDFIQTFSVQDTLELFFLKKEEKNIGSVILFTYKDAVLLYNSGFDPAFSSLSPGFVLVALTIRHAIEKGRKRFDFLRGNERYKYDLGGRERKLYHYA